MRPSAAGDQLGDGTWRNHSWGELNVAAGAHSLAAGLNAHAGHDGTFVFADNQSGPFASMTANSFNVRASGGVRFVTGTGLTPWSCVTSSGNSWSCSSDRRLKQDLAPLDGDEVLVKLAAVPIYACSPKGPNADVRHYGPMAQDFHAAFRLGDDDTLIGMQDADGVALAAIQGLNRKLEITALRSRNALLEAVLRDVAEQVRTLRATVARDYFARGSAKTNPRRNENAGIAPKGVPAL